LTKIFFHFLQFFCVPRGSQQCKRRLAAGNDGCEIARLLEISLNKATVPSDWKRAIVVPIYRGGVIIIDFPRLRFSSSWPAAYETGGLCVDWRV